jgi:hypothetical protein
MSLYDFQCLGCGWEMERLVSGCVMEIKCPICGDMSKKQMAAPKKKN